MTYLRPQKDVHSLSKLRETLANVTLSPGILMVPFDAVSLFITVPVSLALEVIEERWNELACVHTALD